ncbi:MAG TPA: hypothetical protein ENJ11_09660 [Gammaproteobacteria bacterium]|nr:hypothetical protein [Gammaproteobacteria bacterium]
MQSTNNNPIKKSTVNKAIKLALTMTVTAGLYSGSVLGTRALAIEADNTASHTVTDIVANETRNHDTSQRRTTEDNLDSDRFENYTVTIDMGGNSPQVYTYGAPVRSDRNDLAAGDTTLAGTADINKASSDKALQDRGEKPLANPDKASLQVARLGSTAPLIDASLHDTGEKLLEVLGNHFSLDVYFRSGSASLESFYPARLAAIAQLLNSTPDLEVHLDGYSDRRGDREKNRELAASRVEQVRQQLLRAGVAEERIITTAYGEMKMVSAPGDLEGYTFDRKVVIRFERMSADSMHSMKQALSATNTGLPAAENPGSISPLAADAIAQF